MNPSMDINIPSLRDLEPYGIDSSDYDHLQDLPPVFLKKLSSQWSAHKDRMQAVTAQIETLRTSLQQSQAKLSKLEAKEGTLLDERKYERDKLEVLEKEETRAIAQDNAFFTEISKEDAQNDSRTEQLKKEFKRVQEEKKRIISVKVGSRTAQNSL
mmetsp:Transcript_73/g.150  ORF Transcript_73/g.150 Transcript_73/m.150 type:complete len:156 (-) Transcript_73:26-493(-)